MQNYSDIIRATIAEFESPIVPADQGDQGKGQVILRAGYRIHQSLNVNIGYLKKSPGQTQFAGVAVDALFDRTDGSGADFLTDEAIPGDPARRRVIKSVYVPYATPPPGSPPLVGWVEPTAAYLTVPGPLVLKGSAPGPIPPTPIPPTPIPPAPTFPDESTLPTVWSPSDFPFGGFDWMAEMGVTLSYGYYVLLHRPKDNPTDFLGALNWLTHIVTYHQEPAFVWAAIRTSPEYQLVHGLA
jgi:hypothetical protein